jgi:hypothetical protein
LKKTNMKGEHTFITAFYGQDRTGQCSWTDTYICCQ